jgi:hypothetical protein
MSHVNTKPSRHLFVNVSGWSLEFDPNKYFTTITAAVAAAAALVPLPSATEGVLIHVYPGTYTESFTLGRTGVHVAAIPQQRAFATRIVGTVTIDLGAAIARDSNFVSLTGLNITRVLFTGANPQKLYIKDCAIENGAASHTFEMTNTGVEAGTTPSQVISENLSLVNFNAGAFRCLFRSAGQFECFRGFMRKTPDTDFAIELSGAGVSGAGFVLMSNTDVDGRISVAGNAPLTFALSDVSTASAVAAAIASTSTGLIVLGDISVGCAFPGAAISVAGALVSGAITFTAAGSVISAGAYVALTKWEPPFTYNRAVVASGAITAQDQILLATGGAGGITLTLPAAAGMFRRTFTVKKVDAGVGAVTVDGAGAETIDGALSVLIASQYEALNLYSDGASWHIV